MFSGQYFFTKRVILQPLRILKNKSSEISFNPEHLGEEMPLPRSRELGEVVSAFNNMSVKLRDHRNELEDEVNKRTAEIKGLNEQYEQLVEGTENFVTRVDTEGKFLYVNQTSEKIYGLRPEECIGLSAFDFIHPDDREMTRNAFVSWLANKTENITFENRQVSCSGQVRDMLWTCTLRFDESGEVVWIDSIAKDITERKEVESALQVKTYDLGERVKELNCLYGLSHLAEQDGISLEEVFQGLTELIQAGWQYPEITAARITFEGRHFETANFRKTAWIQSADIKVRGQKIGGIKVCYLKKMPEIDEGPFLKEERDLLNALAERSGKIISRKQAENELKDTHDELEARVTQRTYQLRQLNKQLIHAEQGERRRLARVLHDHLQQMLVGAKLNIGILTLKLKDPSLCRSLNEVNSLLDDCIDESRSLTVELCPPVLHEGSFIAAIQWLGRRFENQYRLTVAIDAEGNFDHIEQDCRVFIFEAVRELLFNIVKHAGTNTAAIRMSCTADNLIRVVIEDEGAGFDVEQYEDRKKLDGGFGLFSIRERIAAIGGTLDISSWPGEGTHATLLVPLSSFCPLELGASETASQPSSASKQSSGPDEGSGSEGGDDKIRVLLAEDHAIVRESLNSLLGQEADIEVVGEACNGKVAVEMTSLKQPEFVIMDINMPVMDGVEATRRIKSEYPHIKVIALSAHDQEDMADAIIHAGAESYLSKKNASEQLVSAIRLRRS
jgi:PAS domain S-box-containing protein